MKRIYTSLLLICGILFLMLPQQLIATKQISNLEQMPDKVKHIISKSCIQCHSTSSKDAEAKEALDFKQFNKRSKIQAVSAYKKIEKSLIEETMPPQSFLIEFPEKQLSEAEKDLLLQWSKKSAVAIVKSL